MVAELKKWEGCGHKWWLLHPMFQRDVKDVSNAGETMQISSKLLKAHRSRRLCIHHVIIDLKFGDSLEILKEIRDNQRELIELLRPSYAGHWGNALMALTAIGFCFPRPGLVPISKEDVCHLRQHQDNLIFHRDTDKSRLSLHEQTHFNRRRSTAGINATLTIPSSRPDLKTSTS
jgi:hypothetical protein